MLGNAGQVIAAAGVERPQVRKVRLTAGGGNSKESATEIYRQRMLVRVEWQCKRLPPFW